jgi:hypothetical protein
MIIEEPYIHNDRKIKPFIKEKVEIVFEYQKSHPREKVV